MEKNPQPPVETPTEQPSVQPQEKKNNPAFPRHPVRIIVLVLIFFTLCGVLTTLVAAKLGIVQQFFPQQSTPSVVAQPTEVTSAIQTPSTVVYRPQKSPGPTPTPDLPHGEFIENKEDALYPGLDWEIDTEREKLNHVIEYKNFTSPELNGQQWSTDIEEIDKDTDISQKISDFYSQNKFAPDDHWVSGYRATEVYITPMGADGPGGSIWGFIMVQDEKLQVINFSYHQSKEKYSNPTYEGFNFSYPRTTTYTVFISDPTPIADLLKAD